MDEGTVDEDGQFESRLSLYESWSLIFLKGKRASPSLNLLGITSSNAL